jgi:hypothetical protein
MKHANFNLIRLVLILGIGVMGVVFTSCNKAHVCGYTLCSMKGQTSFKGCGACERGSDCWVLDSAHFIHPSWTYDECETWVFDGK